MNKMDAIRSAVDEIGEARAETLAAHVERSFRIKIDPRVIPVFVASMRDLDRLTQLREQARAARRSDAKVTEAE